MQWLLRVRIATQGTKSMPNPISPATAWHFKIMAENSGRTALEHMSESMRGAVVNYASRMLTDPNVLIDQIATEGDEKDQQIAKLRGLLHYTEGSLAEWLSDNTDEVFEEQPEIDGLRGIILDHLDPRSED